MMGLLVILWLVLPGFSEISCKFPHTLILLNNDDWSEDERQAQALVTAMGLAVAQVKKTYPVSTKHLKLADVEPTRLLVCFQVT